MIRTWAAVLIPLLALAPLAVAQESLVSAPLPHAKGQSVSPSFEGWYANGDGSFSLVFGYFNRNYEEHISLPIGQHNYFEPGAPDRGQPTFFYPRRQTGAFAVVVPADFGERQLRWSLTANGEQISIPGHLRPEWEITALEEVTSGNTPPVLGFGEAGDEQGQGPLGVTSSPITVQAGRPATVTIWASDDGVKKSRAIGQPARAGLVLSKYRGAGGVQIENSRPPIAAGRASTTVTFERPGDYMLRVLGWDDSGGQGPIMAGGFFCCWTNGFIPVIVE